MNNSKRYFFALFPDATVRHSLGQVVPSMVSNLSGDLLHSLDWHITLVFLGNLPEEQQRDLPFLIKDLKVAPFEIELTKVAYWSGPRVVWLGPETTPPMLSELVSQITATLQQAGLSPDIRSYIPHVTLLRGAKQPPASSVMQPIRWQVKEFALAYSQSPTPDGIRYTVQNRWQL